MSQGRLPAEFNLNPPAGTVAIEALACFALTPDYLHFLKRHNGGEGFLDNSEYAVLWRAEDLAASNREYGAAQYAPEAFFFGSNGGGEGYAFDRRRDPMCIVAIPFVGMEMKVALPLAESFTAFLNGSWKFSGRSTR